MVKKTISYFLLTIFLAFYVGSTFFLHTHIINGITIAHSHFYGIKSENGNPAKQHQHNASEIILIQFLSDWTSDTAQPSTGIQAPSNDGSGPHLFIYSDRVFVSQLTTPTLRGPPNA